MPARSGRPPGEAAVSVGESAAAAATTSPPLSRLAAGDPSTAREARPSPSSSASRVALMRGRACFIGQWSSRGVERGSATAHAAPDAEAVLELGGLEQRHHDAVDVAAAHLVEMCPPGALVDAARVATLELAVEG